MSSPSISVISTIPRPIYDLVDGFCQIRGTRSAYDAVQPGSAQAALFGVIGGGPFLLPPAKQMVLAAFRITLAALGVIGMQTFAHALPVAACVGVAISAPSVAILAGACLLKYSASSLVQSLATGSLQTLGLAAAAAVGGLATLKFHDILPFGLGEFYLDKLANQLAPSVARFIAK
jgi:hypothetical protein